MSIVISRNGRMGHPSSIWITSVRFEFQATTKDEGLNAELKTLMEIQSKPLDSMRVLVSAGEFFRLVEARRLLDGDTGVLLINNGTVQGIEADLIRQPPDNQIDPKSSHEWVNGVEVDGAGAVRRYSIYGRQRGGVASLSQETWQPPT